MNPALKPIETEGRRGTPKPMTAYPFRRQSFTRDRTPGEAGHDPSRKREIVTTTSPQTSERDNEPVENYHDRATTGILNS